MSHTRIRIGGASGYDVIVGRGALDELPSSVARLSPAACAVIAPAALGATHGARAQDALRGAGIAAELITFDDAEALKTRATWADLTDRMLELRFGRDTCVIALGGGVTGDVAGFVAATYMRGIPFVQVPTTLLAMIDASVGGKTGVDTVAGKNLVGAFKTPVCVIADPDLLASLPQLQLRSGLAEAVKHGAILDEEYFRWIATHATDLLAADPATLARLIIRSVELKADVVERDPYEAGQRAILNFGHTIGHGLETLAGFTMLHGDAVAAGMCAEAALGEACGVTEAGTADAITRVLRSLGLPAAARYDVDALIDTLAIDKKARAGTPRFALLRRIGESARNHHGGWTHPIEADILRAVLHRHADAPDAV